MPFKPCEVHRDARSQIYPHDVATLTHLSTGKLSTLSNQALGEEESHCKFVVVSRSPHGDRDAAVNPATFAIKSNPNLQWLLDGKGIGLAGKTATVHAEDGDRKGRIVCRVAF